MRPNSLILIINNNSLLVQKGEDSKKGIVFCRPIGGGINFGEISLSAIRREISEEIGATLENEKLLKVIENIFEYNGKVGHEITFLYSGELLEKELYAQEKISILDKKDDHAEWIPISDLKNGKIKIFPKECLDYI